MKHLRYSFLKGHRLVLAFLALLLLSPFASQLPARNLDTREKIQLLSEALRARDTGDLAAARANLQRLLEAAPGDESVQRLLAGVNEDIARRERGNGAVIGRGPDPGMLFSPGNAPNVNQRETSSSTLTRRDVDDLLRQAEVRESDFIREAREGLAEARRMIRRGEWSEADRLLVRTRQALPAQADTRGLAREIDAARGDLLLRRAREALSAGQFALADELLDNFESQYGANRQSDRLRSRMERAQGRGSVALTPEEALDADFRERRDLIQDLIMRARAQLYYGDVDGARFSLDDILLLDPHHEEAQIMKAHLAESLYPIANRARPASRQEMLNEVGISWTRPVIIEETGREEVRIDDTNPIIEKLNRIIIPRVTFNGELSRVIETLSELSVQYDDTAISEADRGVNIVLIDPTRQDPRVNISLRNLSLARILEFVTKQVNYQYDVDQDAVVVSRGDAVGGNVSLVTQFFPISRATVIRLTGFRSEQASTQSFPADPFAPVSQSTSQAPSVSEEEESLMSFFARAGVPFEKIGNGPPGSTLAFDGTQLIVTQTPRNLERLRNILRRYDQTRQVEIEAKFLEVQQGDFEELGFQWGFFGGGRPTFDPQTGRPILDATGRPVLQYDTNFRTSNRSLNSAFSIDADDASINITGPAVGRNTFPSLPPTTPGSVDLGSDVTTNLFGRMAILSGDNVEFMIRALARKTGSDLLSSPRLTVLSGKTASIVVAQELLYPTRYGDIQLPAPGGSREGSVSTIAIAAGTPQDFQMRNIGVEMEVTPTVEDNDNISLLLEPKVTEFEGFVEYGGPSVAVGGDGTVVTVPSGFFQPIFSTREVRTEVTIYDGATVVIGGLVREEVKSFKDKVPILGDIPFVGRLFRSEGETAQKRNLMIFVTANLISPGGSPSRQRMQRVEPNTLFQNPSLITPGGRVDRRPDDQ